MTVTLQIEMPDHATANNVLNYLMTDHVGGVDFEAFIQRKVTAPELPSKWHLCLICDSDGVSELCRVVEKFIDDE